ncbi:MAG: ORF6N domain-containing protein [Bryobacteraceae bacterium]|jgi:hypothetical protein
MQPKRKTHKTAPAKSAVVSIASIERRIYIIRGQKIMLDRDLAELYGVRTMALKQQVKRNADRFPRDFTFRLSKKEAEFLISQNVISTRRSFSRILPSAFTEQGVAMLSSVLKGERSARVNVRIMRAFVHMREVLAGQKDILKKLDELEKKYETHDTGIKAVFDALKQLIQPPAPPHRKIGFIAEGPRR